MSYAELRCRSAFSFLVGADQPETMAAQAAALGMPAAALTDRDSLSGAVRFGQACQEAGIRPVFGVELTLAEGRLVALAEDDRGWANLSRLVSKGQLAGTKGQPRLALDDLADCRGGLTLLTGGRDGVLANRLACPDDAIALGRRLRDLVGRHRLWVELQNHLLPDDTDRMARLAALAERLNVGLVAANDAHYALRAGHRRQDVLACVRLHCTVDDPHPDRLVNAEYALKPAADIAPLFTRYPEAVTNTIQVAERCQVDLDFRGARFPDFPLPWGETPPDALRRLVDEGAKERYGEPGPGEQAQIAHELGVINRLGLAEYFLIVWDIVRFCRERNILAQGRGSAANSVVCYCLGITAVDPIRLELLFERFLSEERSGAPDIDIDIANADREAVIQYVYDRYGREHAGMVCEYISYRPRSAIRDVGKALGLSLAQVDALAKNLDSRHELPPDNGAVPDETARLALTIAQEIQGFPRHLGIHVGGMIITSRPLVDIVPVERATMPGRTVVQWDKDDVEAAGLIKIDLLGLGMLSLIRDALVLVREHEGVTIDLAKLPAGDPLVYDLLCAADTIGVFQVESRAQMQTLPRLRPRTFYDLVVEVALIRPGPIQGQMVHPYLRRRNGEEPVSYPHPSLEPILRKTLGVPLFQEQGMRLAIAAAGFTPGQADRLRKAMGHKRSRQQMEQLKADLVAGMAANGISQEAAEQIFFQLSAFADYGFPESHAASFALLVYASAYLKHYHPAAFYCALLNNQPMGFYQPAVIVGDARRHGIAILPVDVGLSGVRCSLEVGADGALAVRLGYRYVRGIGEEMHEPLTTALAAGPFRSLEDAVQRSALPRDALANLIAVGAFDSLGFSRRELLWRLPAALRRVREGQLPEGVGTPVDLPPPTDRELARTDYRILGLSPDYHPVAFYRALLTDRGVTPAAQLVRLRDGARVRVAGLSVIRQRPPTAKGHVFITLEDETGLANLILRPATYERYRPAARNAPLLLAEGRLQRQHGAMSVLVERIEAVGSASRTPIVPPRNFR